MADNIVKYKFADVKPPKAVSPISSSGMLYFGDKHKFPKELQYLYNKSSKHAALINGKVTYILGNGFDINNKANEKETWNDISVKLLTDIENHGYFYLECIPKFGGGFNFYHLPVTKVCNDKDLKTFYYSEDFENLFKYPAKPYPAYNPSKKEKSIFYYREYRLGYDCYSLPSYFSCANYIMADIEVSKAILTNAKCGFSASKLINFFNGEPDEEKKYQLYKDYNDTVTGAEGERILLSFNEIGGKEPTMIDLGVSDLTKESYGAIDDLITNNIFAGHSITHPLLFGIQQEGKLGNATELQVSYDIFKNTYVNFKQRNYENVVSYLCGVKVKLQDVKPVGIYLDPVQFKDMLPKEWILENLGIDATKYNLPATSPVPEQQQAQTNSTLTNLSGRQMQGISRIVRQFTQGKLTKEQAAIMLKNGFGFTDEDVNVYLGIDDNPNTDDFSEDEVAEMFAAVGEDANNFEVVENVKFDGFISNEEFGILDRIKSILKPKKKEPQVEIMYSYEKRPEATGATIISTTRPFCRKIIQANKYFTAEAIQAISQRVGYDVMRRAGGFWKHDGINDVQCRHEWRTVKVIRK